MRLRSPRQVPRGITCLRTPAVCGEGKGYRATGSGDNVSVGFSLVGAGPRKDERELARAVELGASLGFPAGHQQQGDRALEPGFEVFPARHRLLQ